MPEIRDSRHRDFWISGFSEFWIRWVGSGPIGFLAPLRFKALDSQPEKSNMGSVQADVHDLGLLEKSNGPVDW